MKKIEAKANIMEMANKKGRKIAISELPSIYKKDGQKVICEDGAIRSDDACFYPEGKKADGTARGCSSTAKVKSVREAASRLFDDIYNKLENDLTDEEKKQAEEAIEAATRKLCEVDYIFEQVNNRIAAAAKEAAKVKREEAAKERAQNKMNNKLKESSDNEKIAALAAVLDITFDEAKIIFEKKRAQKTA